MWECCSECGADVLDIDVKCGSCGARLSSTGAQRMIGTVVLGDYAIEDVLGQGGMAIVYRARHRVTDQEVALKILPPELAAHRDVKDRFLEEAKALAQLDHPNIVHLYNFGEQDASLALAMQFVRGSTFERLILSEERLDWQVAVRVIIDVVRALEYAHARGIVHRDMKPGNILVRDSDGAATVMDFGIAKMTRASSRLTATGQTMGTVRYMAPEQVKGNAVDARTDIYSLGATLYEALVGDTPFDGDTHFEIMQQHVEAPPEPPSARGVRVPARVERAVMGCLAKNPNERPQKVGEVAALLEAALEESSAGSAETFTPRDAIVAPGPSAPAAAGAPTARRSGPVVWGAMAAVVLVAAAGVVLAVRKGGADARAPEPEPPPPADPAAPAPEPRWPEPFVLPGLRVAVDETFEDRDIRVMSVKERDVAPIREAVTRARERFAAFLNERGRQVEPGRAPPVTVVLAPARVLCDRRLYENTSAWEECEQSQLWYRPKEHTLYLSADADRWRANLAYATALGLCLHGDIPGCDDALTEYDAEEIAAE